MLSKLEILCKNYFSKGKNPSFFLANWMGIILVTSLDVAILSNEKLIDISFNVAFLLAIMVLAFWSPEERFWDLRVYFKGRENSNLLDTRRIREKHLEHSYIISLALFIAIPVQLIIMLTFTLINLPLVWFWLIGD